MPENIQFDTSEITISGKNITESASYEQAIYFNESYVVAGEIKAPKIYASYDLVVLGDLVADEVEIRGKLIVTGKITAKVLTVEKSLICGEEISSEKIVVNGNLQAESIYCNVLNCFGNVVVQTIAEVNKEIEIQNIFVALEGIIGLGNMHSPKVVVGEYFEFEGETTSQIIDLGEEDMSDENYLEQFKNNICSELKKSGNMDEDHLRKLIYGIAELDKSHWYEWADLIDRIIELSYEDHIQNFRDYLLVLYANYIFPKEVTSYETLAHVFSKMLKEAEDKCAEMNYMAQNVNELSQSIKIITNCAMFSGIDKRSALDKVFQSIGIKYRTVEKFLGLD